MLAAKDGRTLPGWRDLERSVALALGGTASESKEVFDVVLSRRGEKVPRRYGISCKMRAELSRIDRDGRVTIEVSNSARKFWDHLGSLGITHANYREVPTQVGIGLVDLVHRWHETEGAARNLDLAGSCYLVLSWHKATGQYQLHQFPLQLFDAGHLNWSFPRVNRSGSEVEGQRLCGDDDSGRLVEWYGESGGQLKYYPLQQHALWMSARFRLEPLRDVEHGIINKAGAYFPDLWAEACKDPDWEK
ncbi:MAG: hypothetical protein NTU88_17680 [Armatimonadetes bacterium]|nr:hypothetical protein [Armatimonadota bacterium]